MKKQKLILIVSLLFTACYKSNDSFSLLTEGQTFQQSAAILNNKVDIVWVVDSSMTMAKHQKNLATNFNSFISDFSDKNLDFHMSITSTDAWIREVDYNNKGGSCQTYANPTHNPDTPYKSSGDCLMTKATYGEMTRFRDGDIYGLADGTLGVRSGIYLLSNQMNSTTLLNTFATNINTGTRGDGTQESGFQSLRATLRRNADGTVGYNGETHTNLNEFRRNNAFLAVIFVTDEEDQSTKQNGTKYSNTDEYVSDFKNFLNNYTQSTEGNKKYNISSIVVDDIKSCSYGLHAEATQGDRYVAIAKATNGIVSSICNPDFSDELKKISSQILVLSTRFQILREPVTQTIKVLVNGSEIPNDENNGWVFISENGSYFIEFHGPAIPQQGSSIDVQFDPVSVKQ